MLACRKAVAPKKKQTNPLSCLMRPEPNHPPDLMTIDINMHQTTLYRVAPFAPSLLCGTQADSTMGPKAPMRLTSTSMSSNMAEPCGAGRIQQSKCDFQFNLGNNIQFFARGKQGRLICLVNDFYQVSKLEQKIRFVPYTWEPCRKPPYGN